MNTHDSPGPQAHGSDTQNTGHYSLCYERLDSDAVDEEFKTIQRVRKEVEEEWEKEAAKYEETIVIQSGSKRKEMPRRNYFNGTGTVQDPTLFPYHDAFYDLLDAYDFLDYNDDGTTSAETYPHHQPTLDSTDSTRPIIRPPFVPIHLRSMTHRVLEACILSAPTTVQTTVLGFDPIQLDDELEHYLAESLEGVLANEHRNSMLDDHRHVMDQSVEEMWEQLCRMYYQGKSREEGSVWNIPSFSTNVAGQAEGAPDTTISDARLSLFTDPIKRKQVLIQLFQHAVSDLQHDHYLASCILVRLCQFQDVDDSALLRQLLILLDINFCACNLEADDVDEEDDHHCGEWNHLLDTLQLSISRGITTITNELAVCMAAHVKSLYWHEFGHLLPDFMGVDEAKNNNTIDSENSAEVQLAMRKTMLKRTVVALRYVDRTSSYHVPVKLVLTIVKALGSRAYLERRRCAAVLRRGAMSTDDNTDDASERQVQDQVKIYLQSYWNCIRALVDIGKSTIELLPGDSECFDDIASEVVKNLAYALLADQVNLVDPRVVQEEEEGSGYMKPVSLPSLIDPTRYTDSILNATARWKTTQQQHLTMERYKKEQAAGNLIGRDAIQLALEMTRPDDVREVVRALFVRDMVNIRQAAIGYGDFLVWCGYDVHPLDPVLFWHEYQFPVEESDEDDEMEDEDDGYDFWEVDEAGHELSFDELRARYDFTLMALIRAWNAPWTPETHKSFQPEFQEALRTVALCTHRLHWPNDVVQRVGSFLNRNWWADSRRQCWSYDCQIDQLAKQLSQQQGSQMIPVSKKKACKPCLCCGIAYYCSKRCKEDDFKAGHKRMCSSLVPHDTLEEYQLYQSMIKNGTVSSLFPPKFSTTSATELEISETAAQLDSGDDDDDGSWESMDTEEGGESDDERSASSKTKTIRRYFKVER